MYNFDYHKPKDLDDAEDKLTSAEDPKLVAGGMTLIPTLKQRLAQPSDLVDLSDIGDLAGISVESDLVTIGAMTRHCDVAASEEIAKVIPALSNLAGHIGDSQVRHRGTIGGSIANNDPAADYPAGTLGLGATVTTTKRELTADDFFTGLFDTALDEDEIITSVAFPKPKRAAYMKFPNPASRYAIVGVMVAITADGVRVAVTGAGDDGVFRVGEMEEALNDDFSVDAIADVAISDDALLSDIHASAEYRAHLIGVMARRAVEAAS
ncbi:MAG TPA: carbon monoxide dehydrogenase [Rhodospirillaceae bacterium]|nr:carbon monoxide dehydrogenase [Rhodospirillaceae bacterium]